MSEPNSTSTNPTSQPVPSRDRDEWVAVVVALLVLGGVGTWILGREAIAAIWRDRVPEWVSLDWVPAAPSGPFPDRSSRADDAGRNRAPSFFTGRSPDPSEDATASTGRSSADAETASSATSWTSRPTDRAPGAALPFFNPTPFPSTPSSPGSTAPGSGTPGSGTPGSGTPGSGTPDATTPGSEVPDSATGNEGLPPAAPPPITSETPAAPQALDPVAKPAQITDVPDDYWAAPFIDALIARGVIAGFEDGTYRPDEPVTRAELAALVNRVYADLADRQAVKAFQDVPADYWANEAIARSTRIGFMSGYPGQQFRPEQSISRLEVLLTFAAGLELRSPDLPDVLLKQTFQDSDQVAAWAQPNIAAATRAGLPANSPDPAKLEPNRPATRSEVAVMLYQALVASGRIDPIPSPYLSEP